MFSLKKLIRLSSNDDKRMQGIDSMATYAYGTNKDLVCNKEGIKCNKKKNKKRHIPNWQQILDHPYRVLITGGSGSGKTSIILSNKSATRY